MFFLNKDYQTKKEHDRTKNLKYVLEKKAMQMAITYENKRLIFA